ncbi:hypothetical protein HAX54_000842 [Datura stramonium]|uniref:Uncharacterized protein n=1 Tax=Datura stramonium TaxID=4076 RepID=A0ABS8RS58_DATST|nr:hypothetical protein [Datura stramonium]
MTVPPQLGVAPVLTGKSLLVEACHPKGDSQRRVRNGALRLLGAVRLQVEQWISREALLLVLMRCNFRWHIMKVQMK